MVSFLSVDTDDEEKLGRSKRSISLDSASDSSRSGRKFCDNGGGV